MQHLMIDIETLGTGHESVIVQIGAVAFDPQRNIVTSTFYSGVTIISCRNLGLKVDTETLLWWMQQDDQAREGFVKSQENGLPLEDALISLSKYIDIENPKCIWVKGLSFDVPILKTAFEVCGLECPWKYYQEGDHRTLLKMCSGLTFEYPEQFIAHDALGDAKKQAYECMAALRMLGVS